MLNRETTGWGDFRKLDNKIFSLYNIASHRDNEDVQKYRKKIRKQAKDSGHTHVRVIKDIYGNYATYVYPTWEELEEDAFV